MPIGLKDSMKLARFEKEQEIIAVLLQRPDLSYESVGKLFGVSEWPIKQIVEKNRICRRRGRKPRNISLVAANGPEGV